MNETKEENKMNKEKNIEWVGSSKDDLLMFPKEVKQKAGFQLHRVQSDLEPDDWKPLDNIGSGIKEIRLHDDAGIYRVVYIAKFKNVVYVLHCFSKKENRIKQKDKEIIITRYKSIKKE
jgi:phage-related protein